MNQPSSAKIPSLLFTLIVLVLALILGAPPTPAPLAQAQQASAGKLREVLRVGDPAPGFEAGATIAAVGDTPRVDDSGSITFVVTVRNASGGDAGQAIYRVAAGAPELVFRSGDMAPGTGERFLQFPGVPQTPRINQGRLTFAASEGVADGTSRSGLWSDRSGSFDLLALQGDHLPGMPGDGALFNLDFVVRGGAVLLDGEYSQGANVPPQDEGLWRHRAGSWELLLVNGMQAPGLGSGVVFDTDPTTAYGPLFAFDGGANGRALAQAWVSGPGIDENNDEALWLEGTGGLAILVREGAAAPIPGGKPNRSGGTFGPTLSSPTFGGDGENLPAVLNNAGAIVFGAVLRTNEGRLSSVWTTRSGSLELLVKGGLPLSGFAKGSQAPGFPAGVTFATFTATDINERNEIAFEGFADEFGNAADLTEGIWWDHPGQLTLVAAEGRPVPSIPGAVFFDLTFESLRDDGTLYYSARLTGEGINAGNNTAFFRVNPDLTTDVVLREGNEVEVVGPAGSTLRTIGAFGVGRGATTDGQRVAQVVFRDGTSGVYLLEPAFTGGCTPVESPELSCTDGRDNDCDGLIDGADPDCRPVCRLAGATCSIDGDCCSGQCRVQRGSRTCR